MTNKQLAALTVSAQTLLFCFGKHKDWMGSLPVQLAGTTCSDAWMTRKIPKRSSELSASRALFHVGTSSSFFASDVGCQIKMQVVMWWKSTRNKKWHVFSCMWVKQTFYSNNIPAFRPEKQAADKSRICSRLGEGCPREWRDCAADVKDLRDELRRHLRQ